MHWQEILFLFSLTNDATAVTIIAAGAGQKSKQKKSFAYDFSKNQTCRDSN